MRVLLHSNFSTMGDSDNLSMKDYLFRASCKENKSIVVICKEAIENAFYTSEADGILFMDATKEIKPDFRNLIDGFNDENVTKTLQLHDGMVDIVAERNECRFYDVVKKQRDELDAELQVARQTGANLRRKLGSALQSMEWH